MKALGRLALTACTLAVCCMLSTAVLAHHGRSGYGSDSIVTIKGVVAEVVLFRANDDEHNKRRRRGGDVEKSTCFCRLRRDRRQR